MIWRRAGKLRWELACFAGAAVVSAVIALQWAAPLWDLPLLGAILGFAQFPWRWFAITVVCMSVLAGALLHPLVEKESEQPGLPLLALVAAILVGSYPLLRVEISEPVEGPVGLPALMRFQQSSDEMTGSTAWVKEIPTWSSMADTYVSQEKAGGPVEPLASMVDYTMLDYNQETGFVVNSEARNTVMEEVWYWSPLEGRRIIFNQFYYPGWKAYLLDGRHGNPVRELAIIPEEEGTLGRMTVPVPVGEGFILLRFEDTPPRIAGQMISLATLAALALVAAILPIYRRLRARSSKDKSTG
jgi:hypothetical protein